MAKKKIDCTWFWSFIYIVIDRKIKKKEEEGKAREKDVSTICNNVLAFSCYHYLRPGKKKERRRRRRRAKG
jgi:hypothetical protein